MPKLEPFSAWDAVLVPIQPGMIGQDLDAAADQQGKKQEIDEMVKAQPEWETEESSVVKHGLEVLSWVGQVFSNAYNREHLADGFFCVLPKAPVG